MICDLSTFHLIPDWKQGATPVATHKADQTPGNKETKTIITTMMTIKNHNGFQGKWDEQQGQRNGQAWCDCLKNIHYMQHGVWGLYGHPDILVCSRNSGGTEHVCLFLH